MCKAISLNIIRLLDDDNGGSIGFPEIQKTLDLCNAKVRWDGCFFIWSNMVVICHKFLSTKLSGLPCQVQLGIPYLWLRQLKVNWCQRIWRLRKGFLFSPLASLTYNFTVHLKVMRYFFFQIIGALFTAYLYPCLNLLPSGGLEDIWRSWWVWCCWRPGSSCWGPCPNMLVSGNIWCLVITGSVRRYTIGSTNYAGKVVINEKFGDIIFKYDCKYLNFRKNNLEEVTEENFCELATKDSRMGNIVMGVYRCFIGDILTVDIKKLKIQEK